MAKPRWLFCLLLLIAIAPTVAARTREGGKRRALVIAISEYRDPWEPLENTLHDLEDMTKKLRGLDFEVTRLKNPTKRQMVDATHELVDGLSPGDVALFYFSGHGVQVNGENYLIPKGFDSAYEADVDDGTFHVKLLKDNLETREGVVSIIVLDACRTDGLKRGRKGGGERGLTPMPDLPQGMLVAFASAANQPALEGSGRNGVYTAALLKHLGTPGQRIDDLLRDVARDVYSNSHHAQLPAIYGTMLDPFCLTGKCGAGGAAVEPTREAPALMPAPPVEETPAPDVDDDRPRVKKAQVTAAVGTLTIVAKPKDLARVELVDPDGRKSVSGGAYENKAAKPGTWKVRVRASGYEEQSQDVEVPADDVALVRIELQPLGGLKVTGTPAGAAVSVTGPDGFHDEGGLPWEADGLKSGPYQVKVTRPGYGTDEERVDVKPGDAARVRVALSKEGSASGGAGTKVEPKSGLTFIRLPGGTFHYGCEPQDTQCLDDEKPGKSVTVQGFWLGKTTVTVEAYGKCVSAGACAAPNTAGVCNWQVGGKEQHPVNCVDWNQATAFCQWIGGRLPTAEEWEYAAKGGESRIYPWGNEAPDGNRALFGKPYPGDGTAPADSYGGGASKHGLLNMAGNVWQWTASNYDANNKELRGGSWSNDPQTLRASHRLRNAPGLRHVLIGFRCGL